MIISLLLVVSGKKYSINILHIVTSTADDIKKFKTALQSQKAESKLFQFLNGLDDYYSALRSQLLMLQPLPTVEVADAAIQQEESQSDLLSRADIELSAMFTKSNLESRNVSCTACGGRGHSADKCWTVVGYPKWHHKHKKPAPRNYKGSHPKNENFRAHNAQASGSCDKSEVVLSQQQLQQLL